MSLIKIAFETIIFERQELVLKIHEGSHSLVFSDSYYIQEEIIQYLNIN